MQLNESRYFPYYAEHLCLQRNKLNAQPTPKLKYKTV